MELAIDRFKRILDENNLTVNLQEPQLRSINKGGLIIEPALLSVTFTDPSKEVANEPIRPIEGEQSTTPMEGEIQNES